MPPHSTTATLDEAWLHALNNFLNRVTVPAQLALDPELDYGPEKALEGILEGAAELRAWIALHRATDGAQPERSQEPPVAAGPFE